MGKYTTVVGDCSDANKIVNHDSEFFNEINLDSEDFLLSPNPANGIIEISLGSNFDKIDTKWTICNLFGQKVLNGDLSEEVQKINIGSLGSGIFIMSVIEDDKIKSKKFLIN